MKNDELTLLVKLSSQVRQKVKLHSISFPALKTESAKNGRADL